MVLKKRVLVSWVGKQDLDESKRNQLGPIASILLKSEHAFDEVRLLSNNWFEDIPDYQRWLSCLLAESKRKAEISERQVYLNTPIDYIGIYEIARRELEILSNSRATIALNLTSGTPAMIANWLLLGKGVYNTELWQTSVQNGLQQIQLPYDISLEYLQNLDGRLNSIASSSPDVSSKFEHIPCNSPLMKEVVNTAQKLSMRNVPALVMGESGTGKEVVAQAIHASSLRHDKPFIAVNCGAIPESLIDSQLFGHKKGAFTGAIADHKGYFEQAHEGTLFLDELGELLPDAQVKLLRALQQKEITPIGGNKAKSVDVRIVAATHRDLMKMVEAGTFREDLFYRLAVGVIQLPPLRMRQEDISELVYVLLHQINQEAKDQPGYESKEISPSAIEFIRVQKWPGNIRELWNTLVRASIWSEKTTLSKDDLRQALIQRSTKIKESTLDIDISEGVDANKILCDTKSYLINESLRLTSGQKVKAAALLGLNNHQTLTNWMKQLDISDK